MNDSTVRTRKRRGSPETWSVDVHVGKRLKTRRTLLGMSQEKLGEALGLTFQQIQKYEKGSNRISAGTLYRLGQILDVPVSFFFDLYAEADASGPGHPAAPDPAAEAIGRRDARLLRLWRSAPPHIADRVLALLSAMTPELATAADEGVTPPASGASPSSSFARGATRRPSAARSRRRRGAVWDPTDIARAADTMPR